MKIRTKSYALPLLALVLLVAVYSLFVQQQGAPLPHEPPDIEAARMASTGSLPAAGADTLGGDLVRHRLDTAPAYSTSTGNRRVMVVSKSSGEGVTCRIGCSSCGTEAEAFAIGGAELAHDSTGSAPHRIWALAPGFNRGEVLVDRVRATGTDGVITVALEAARRTSVVLRLDPSMGIGDIDLLWGIAPTFLGLKVPSGSPEASNPVGPWTEAESSVDNSVVYLAYIDARQPFYLQLGEGGVQMGAMPPGGRATVDLRLGGDRISLYDRDGAVAHVPLAISTPKGHYFFPRTTDSEGDAWLPGQVGSKLDARLDPRLPYRFASSNEASVSVSEDRDTVAIRAFDGHTRLELYSRGWKLRLVSSISGAPIQAALKLSVVILRSNGTWAVARSVAGRSDSNGVCSTALHLPPLPESTVELQLDTPGFASQRISLDAPRPTALDDLRGEGYTVRLEPVDGTYSLQVVDGGQCLFGREVRLSLSDSFRGAIQLRLDRTGRSEFFSAPSGEYSLYLDDQAEAIGSIRLPEVVGSGLPVDVVFRVAEAAKVTLAVTAPAAGGCALFGANLNGPPWPLVPERRGAVQILQTDVLPGNYLIGPLDWVLNEQHRLRFKLFGVSVTAADEGVMTVDWNPRWSSRTNVSTRLVFKGLQPEKASAIPFFEEEPNPFHSSFAPARTPLEVNGEILVPAGDPVPIGYVIRILTKGSFESTTPIGFVSAGQTVEIDLAYIRIPVTPSSVSVQEAPMYMHMLDGVWTVPLCLSMELGEREIRRDPHVEMVFGPIDVSRTRLFLGWRHGWGRVFPLPSEVQDFKLETLPR